MKKTFLLFVLCSLSSACTFQTKHRGYVFPENLDAEIVGIKTTAQLEEKFGSPMVKTIYGSPVWIYYGMDENFHGPFSQSYDNKIAMIAYVNDNAVAKIKILRDNDLPNVEIADGETPIPAAIELNALEELFNNVGRFSPAGLGQ